MIICFYFKLTIIRFYWMMKWRMFLFTSNQPSRFQTLADFGTVDFCCQLYLTLKSNSISSFLCISITRLIFKYLFSYILFWKYTDCFRQIHTFEIFSSKFNKFIIWYFTKSFLIIIDEASFLNIKLFNVLWLAHFSNHF